MIVLEHCIMVGILLFGIGLAGVLLRRNLLILLMSVEIMLNGVNLLLLAYGAHWGDAAGQVAVLMAMLVTAAEVAIALALVTLILRRRDTTDTDAFTELKG